MTTGRNIRAIKYHRDKNELAPLNSLLHCILNGGYNVESKQFYITEQDLAGWHRKEFESLTLILVVDVSKSTWPLIKVFKEILSSLTTYFTRHNDRIGLISLQGRQAKIFNHPTHNIRVVARGLGNLRFHGLTPLADGLLKSLQMAKTEQSKNTGSRSVVILLSDCYPEPVAKGCENLFEDPAYKKSITASMLFKKERITFLVINPVFEAEQAKYPGEILSEKIALAGGGKLIKLIRPQGKQDLPPSNDELHSILNNIESSLKQHKFS